MIRGTTPTFQLKISDESVDLTTAENVYATFAQYATVLTKTGEDITVTANQVDVYFTQEESLSFKEGFISIQLNWTYSDGSRASTDIVHADVGGNLIGRVLE